jgi:hypothetical protein
MSRTISRSIAAAGVLVLLCVVCLLFAHPRYSLETLVGDDAGYYLAVSRSAALGHGYSFDRLHATSGFNPLLPWILVPAFRLLPTTASLLMYYRIAAVSGVLAMLAGLWAFQRGIAIAAEARGVRTDASRFVLSASAFLYCSFIATKSYYGMDAFLVLALGGPYLLRVARQGLDGSIRKALVDGALLGLLFLARVDSAVLIAASLGLGIVRVAVRRDGLASLLVRTGVVAALAAPMVIGNASRFGHWLPISAALKTSFPAVHPGQSMNAILHTSLNAADQATFALAYLLAWGVAAVIVRDLARGRGAPWLEAQRVALALYTLYVVGRLTFLLLFSRFDVQGSYAILVQPYIVVVLVLAAGRRVGSPDERARARAFVWLGSALTLVAAVLLAGKCEATWRKWRLLERAGFVDEYTLASEIRARTAPGDVIYGGAYGLIGFFADRPWINGDGVANDYVYQRVVHENRLPAYLAENHVRYVSLVWPHGQPFPPGGIEMMAESHLYGGRAAYRTTTDDVVVRQPTLRNVTQDVCLVRYSPWSHRQR